MCLALGASTSTVDVYVLLGLKAYWLFKKKLIQV